MQCKIIYCNKHFDIKQNITKIKINLAYNQLIGQKINNENLKPLLTSQACSVSF